MSIFLCQLQACTLLQIPQGNLYRYQMNGEVKSYNTKYIFLLKETKDELTSLAELWIQDDLNNEIIYDHYIQNVYRKIIFFLNFLDSHLLKNGFHKFLTLFDLLGQNQSVDIRRLLAADTVQQRDPLQPVHQLVELGARHLVVVPGARRARVSTAQYPK